MAATPDKLKVVKDLSRREVVFRLARVPDTERFYFGCSDFKIYDVDLAAAKPEPKELGGHSSYVTGLVLAGPTLISGGYDGRLIWWDTEQRTAIRSVEAHSKWIRHLVLTRDGTTAASVADDMVCRLWDVSTGKMLHELRGHAAETPHHFPSMLYACAFSPDGRFVATGDKTGHIVVWETATGKQAGVLEAPVMYTWDPVQRRHSIGGIRSLAFSPDGTLLAVGGMGQVGNIDHLEGKARVEVFDWAKGTRTHEFPGDRFSGLVERLAFHPQGDWLVGLGGAGDGFVMFFDLKAKKVLHQDKVAMHVHDAILSEAADTFYVAGHGKILVMSMNG